MQTNAAGREGCHLYTLAKSDVAHVQRCAHCGALAVHLGPLTLRFDQGALGALRTVLGQALVQLQDESAPSVAGTPRHARTGQA